MSNKSTLMQLKENERETRRKLIIDAAVNLFAEKSFVEVHMRDIAAEAGISPASIYRYFSDRDELFLEAFSQKAEEIVKGLEEKVNRDGDLNLESIATNFVEYLINNDSFFQMMTHFMVDSTVKGDSLEKLDTTQRKLLDIFENAFRQEGFNDIARLVSHAFFAALNGIVITFHQYPGRSQDEIRRHMHRLARLTAEIFMDKTHR